MSEREYSSYRRDVAQIALSETNKPERYRYLRAEALTPQYILAHEQKRQLRLQLATAEAEATTNITTIEAPAVPRLEDPIDPKREAMIAWARQAQADYTALPDKSPKDKKKKGIALNTIARSVVMNPQSLEIARSVWRKDDTSDEAVPFYTEVVAACAEQIEKNWQKITPDQLANLTARYAHSKTTKDAYKKMIKAYFEGPSTRSEKLDTLYTLAMGATSLINDVPALEFAILLGEFQTDILPDLFYTDFYISRWSHLHKDADVKKAMNVDTVFMDLTEFTTLNSKQIRDDLFNNRVNTDRILKAHNDASQESVAVLGYAEASKRYQELRTLQALTASGSRDDRDNAKVNIPWAYNIVADKQDPLMLKHLELQPSMDALRNRQAIRKTMKETDGIPNPYFTSAPLIDADYMLDIALPSKNLLRHKSEIIKALLATNPLHGLQSKKEGEHTHALAHSVSILGSFTFNGEHIHYIFRNKSQLDANEHSVSSLDLVGFPIPHVESGNLITETKGLAAKIDKEQIRFLNKRGLRVPVVDYFGEPYQSIDFRREDSDGSIRAIIHLTSGPIPILFDSNLNFAPEGKTIENPYLIENIRYLLLSLLYPILCNEKLTNDAIDGPNLELEIRSRMGHLRLLPDGQKFTNKAVANFIAYEGKDLRAKDEERKKEKKTARYTTYVKPVVKDEEGLEPITIHLPDELRELIAS